MSFDEALGDILRVHLSEVTCVHNDCRHFAPNRQCFDFNGKFSYELLVHLTIEGCAYLRCSDFDVIKLDTPFVTQEFVLKFRESSHQVAD